MQAPSVPKNYICCRAVNYFGCHHGRAGRSRSDQECGLGMILLGVYPAPFHRPTLGCRHLEAQHRLRDAILIFRGGELDLRFSLLQLRLTKFYDRAEAEVVSRF